MAPPHPDLTAAILIGLMASVFANGSHLSHAIFTRIYDNSPYWSLLITPAGLALAIWLMRHYFPGSAGGGIPQSIAALEGGMQAARTHPDHTRRHRQNAADPDRHQLRRHLRL